MIIGIVAISKNYAIGKDGKLPWHYPADLKFFKKTTTGNAIVMGHHTWLSIGQPLKARLNIILSRSETVDNKDVLVLRNKEEALVLSAWLSGDLFVIGGAKTYETFAEHIERWVVTEVPLEIKDADVFMPRDFLDRFSAVYAIDLNDGLHVRIFEKK